MKGIMDEFKKYKYLLVLSISSALFVVAMQTLVGVYFSRSTDEDRDLYLEDAVGEIIPLNQGSQSPQIVSTLSSDQLKEFNDTGQIEDMHIAQDIPSTTINIEKLLLSLDNQSMSVENQEKLTSIQIQHDTHTYINLCSADFEIKKSCDVYLVDKSGQSIPVAVSKTDSSSGIASIINIQTHFEEDLVYGVFTAKPVKIGIWTQ
jgi:hypothetical protein